VHPGGRKSSSALKANPTQFRGVISDGGVITLARGQTIASITDGTSNTVMVAEQSGPMFHNNGQRLPIAGDSVNNDGRLITTVGSHGDVAHGFPNGNNTMTNTTNCPVPTQAAPTACAATTQPRSTRAASTRREAWCSTITVS
jgi:hypothetical protein